VVGVYLIMFTAWVGPVWVCTICNLTVFPHVARTQCVRASTGVTVNNTVWWCGVGVPAWAWQCTVVHPMQPTLRLLCVLQRLLTRTRSLGTWVECAWVGGWVGGWVSVCVWGGGGEGVCVGACAHPCFMDKVTVERVQGLLTCLFPDGGGECLDIPAGGQQGSLSVLCGCLHAATLAVV
jgi:hypothetical protein